MPTPIDGLALVVSAAGLVVFVVAVVAARSWRSGLAMTLDLWTAAGLLRLTGAADWDRLAAAAAVVALRRLVMTTLARPARGPHAGGTGPPRR